jgi:membrane-bound metal-dependent hydrolase YbcI (DUF457 family)
MGSYQTHMLTGAACGALVAWLVPSVPHVTTAIVPLLRDTPEMQTVAWIVGSGVMALWPDGDHPSSKSARVLWTVGTWMIGGVLGVWWMTPHIVPNVVSSMLAMGWLVPPIWAGLTGVLALVLCLWSGGHRKRTHSLVTASILGGVAGVTWVLASLIRDPLLSVLASAVWISTAGLAWGILCHLPPDICTVAGVPVFYPFRGPAVGKGIVIPEPVVQVVSGGILVVCLIHLWGR